MSLGEVAPLVPSGAGKPGTDERREALSYFAEALHLCRELDDPLGEARALQGIGTIHTTLGNHELARESLEQSLAIRRRAAAPEAEIAASLSGLCQLLVSMGEVERVEPMADELHELGSRLDAPSLQEAALHYLADCPLLRGDYAEGQRRYARALGYARSSGMTTQCANELLGVAMSASGRGDYAQAVRLAEAAYARREALGLSRGTPMIFWGRLQEWFIGGARAHLTPEELDAAERVGSEADFDAVLDEVLGTDA